MMHFSGDKDGSVPTIGTERWVNHLNWTVITEWTPYTLNGQIAGYYEEYEPDFTLITVHGAGHMVPQDQREIAYHILFNWVFRRGEFEEPDKQQPEQKPEFIQ